MIRRYNAAGHILGSQWEQVTLITHDGDQDGDRGDWGSSFGKQPIRNLPVRKRHPKIKTEPCGLRRAIQYKYSRSRQSGMTVGTALMRRVADWGLAVCTQQAAPRFKYNGYATYAMISPNPTPHPRISHWHSSHPQYRITTKASRICIASSSCSGLGPPRARANTTKYRPVSWCTVTIGIIVAMA